jgi:uncharacterized protein
MALVRILIDGYSLLHSFPELAPGKPRYSAAARDELIVLLTRYHDAVGTPISIFFDGAGAPPGTPAADSSPEVEVLFSKAGQTADQMIERVAHRMSAFGEVLVVTDDFAERDTVFSVGGMIASCSSFLRMIEEALGEMERDVQQYNRRELRNFRRSKS